MKQQESTPDGPGNGEPGAKYCSCRAFKY